MSDMSAAIKPKSDQLNSDDLIAGPITITVTKTSVNSAGGEQPVSLYFEGDNGKPYKPCKSMSRVLVAAWKSDSKEYIGRAMTLFRDPEVTWAGMKVGGIRISHMSHIDKPLTLALTANKKSRAMYTVQPLKGAAGAPAQPAAKPQPTPAAALPEPTPEKPFAMKASSKEAFIFATTQEWREKAFEIITTYASVAQCQGFVKANEAAFQTVQQADASCFEDVIAAVVDRENAIKAAVAAA